MKRIACGIDLENWNIGLLIVPTKIGTLLKFSFLIFTLIIRVGGESR